MATTQPGGRITKFEAAADLSAKQWYIVKAASATTVNLASAATDVLLGVLENAPVSGDTAVVVGRHSNETCKVIAGGSITLGAKITSDGNGKAVVTTTTGNQVLGIALEAADANDIFEFMPVYDVIP